MKRIIFTIFCIALVCGVVAQTRSPKRGVSFDFTNNADLEALQFGTSWFYNWGTDPKSVTNTYNKVYGYEFCPMTWNGNWNSNAIRNYVKANPDCKYILAFNEPNFQNQANLTPRQAADRWPDLKALAQELNLKIISPACNYSGWAAYGTPKKWFDEFFQYVPLSDVDGLAIHSYMGWASATAGYMEEYYGYYKKPIWLTEVCQWDDFTQNNGGTALQQRKEMIDLIDALETNDHIAKYAWFMPRRNEVRVPTYPYMDLLTNTNGTERGVLTETGLVFTYMSSYDKNFYHDVNKCIEAEHYITKTKGIYMEQTSDDAGIINVYDFASNRELAYNVNVPTAGTYTVRLRVLSGAATISITSPKGTVTQNIAATQTWANRDFQLDLNAGKQKITFKATNGNLRMNWLVITNNNTFPAAMPNTGAVPPEPPVIPTGDNLALNKPTTASTEFNHGQYGLLKATNATDGNSATRWGSNEINNRTTPEWIMVDLGGIYNINDVVIDWEAAFASAFNVQTSVDGNNWTAYSSETNFDGGTYSVKKSASARYVRVNCTTKGLNINNTYYGYSILELGVYGTTGGNPPVSGENLALNKPIQSSDDANDLTKATAAVDGNDGSRWESKQGEDNKTLTIDLQNTYKLNEVVINWEGAYAKQFDVQVSTNGTNWTTTQSNLTGNVGEQRIAINNVNARYVRINCIERATGYGFSIFEVEVYGTSLSSISDVERSTILMFPNPVDDMLHIWSENPVTKAIVLDLNGRKIFEVMDTNTIDLSTCSTGVYLLHVTLSTGETVVKKIVKQ